MKWLLNSHLKGQNVDQAFATEAAARMKPHAQTHGCRVNFRDYWGMLDAAYVQKHLGDRMSGIENFIQSTDDKRNYFIPTTTPISGQAYIFNDKYADAVCDGDAAIETVDESVEGVPGTGEDSGDGASGWQSYLNEIKAFEANIDG